MVSKPFWWIVASRTACFGYPIAPRYFRDFKPTLRGAKSLSWKNTDVERELHHFIILSMKIRHEFMVIWGHLRGFPDIFFPTFFLASWNMTQCFHVFLMALIQTPQGQTMDEVKQPLVLERVQSIALQTRSSFGTPTGCVCFEVFSCVFYIYFIILYICYFIQDMNSET